MDAQRFPSLALHFKAVLKTGSGCRVWGIKTFLANSRYILSSHFGLSKVGLSLHKVTSTFKEKTRL